MTTTRGSMRSAAVHCGHLCAVLLATLVASSARAQTPEAPAAAADRLFREGRSALEAGRYAEACPKLARSQQLDPGMGTLLALALCHEGEGKTASAWREFRQVAEEPRPARGDRVQLAREHIAALEPRLSKLAVAVGAPVPGLDVRRDGEPVARAQWSQVAPVDPGEHVVQAEAPGKKPWKTVVSVGRGGDTIVVSVPMLEDVGAPTSPAAAAPQPSASPQPNDQPPSTTSVVSSRTLGWVVGGAGVLALGVGSGFGLAALSDHGGATSRCPSSPCTDATGVSMEDSAKTKAWVADAGLGLGLVGVAVGAWLVLRPADAARPATTARISPTGGRSTLGLSFVTSW